MKNVWKKAEPDHWETKLDEVKECGKAPKSVTIWIDTLAKVKIDYLMKKMDNLEWLAYLIGDGDIIRDIYIPKQEVTSEDIDNIDTSRLNVMPVLGVIHSHHTMGSFFSGIDKDWINQNNDISLCVSSTGIKGQVRWKTPCGSLKIVPVNLKLNMEIELDTEDFNKIIDERIKKKSYVYDNWTNKNQKNRCVVGYGHYSNEYNDDDDDNSSNEIIPLYEIVSMEKKSLQEQLEHYEESGTLVEPD